jgi:hypothetical protein
LQPQVAPGFRATDAGKQVRCNALDDGKTSRVVR